MKTTLEQWQIDDAARLKALFKARTRLSQEDFGAAHGIGSQGMVWQYLNARSPLNLAAAIKFARGLEIGVADFSPTLAKELEPAITAPPAAELALHANIGHAATDTRRVPVISFVQAGNPIEAIDSYAAGAGMEDIFTDLDVGQYAFALVIKGNSMEPDFREGDKVIIDPDVNPTPGDFVVAKCNGDETTFKKYRPRGINEEGQDVFELVPLNEDYAIIRSDRVPTRVIGTMVEHRRYRRR